MHPVDEITYKVNLDEAVEAYLNMRNEKERIQREADQAIEAINKEMAEIDQIFLGICNETNVNSLNTDHGTVIRQIKERFVCNDWDGFRKFELENPDYDLREKRIHQGNFKQYMEQRAEDGLPPGVNSMREFQIVVRKSSK